MRAATTRAGGDDEGRHDGKGGRQQQGRATMTRAGGDNKGGRRRGRAMGIIYAFNMIILAFEFFYSSSCGLVIACRAK